MKKRFILIVLFISILLMTSACTKKEEENTLPENPETELKEFTITFHTNGGSSIPSQKVKEWSNVVLPEDPIKDKEIFDGWYLDEKFETEFSSVMIIHEDLDLYAKWKVNPNIDVENGYHDDIEWNGSIIT